MVASIYLLPMCDVRLNTVWIDKVHAKGFKEAEEKFIADFVETYDISEPFTWKQCKDYMLSQVYIIVGDISDIEEY